VPALLVTVQFVALAAGKPGEYGRFALLPATGLCLGSVLAVCLFPPNLIRYGLLAALAVATAIPGLLYVAHFIADARPDTPRLEAAGQLDALLRDHSTRRLALAAEPAPYSLPPANLWRWQLELMPRHTDPVVAARQARAGAFVQAVDELPDEVPEGFRRVRSTGLSAVLAHPGPHQLGGKTV
jgi:hypothetical protein